MLHTPYLTRKAPFGKTLCSPYLTNPNPRPPSAGDPRPPLWGWCDGVLVRP
jgi:hypothetical protein